MAEIRYDEDNIRTLEWKEHIRMRPGMYIGKLGDGSSFEDGIYILLKEVIDNSIDEYVMGNGKQIDISHHRWYRPYQGIMAGYSLEQGGGLCLKSNRRVNTIQSI